LPEGVHERVVAEQILLHLRHALDNEASRTAEEKEFIVIMQTTWTQAAEQGRAEGRTEEAVRNLLTVLRVRGIAVPEAARGRILAQKDPKRLESWLERAVVAASITEVLDEPSRKRRTSSR
jgi:hypothetical protein